MEARSVSRDDVGALEQLNRDYVNSAQHTDLRRYNEILAEDFMSTNPDGSLVDKAGFLERIGRGATYTKLTPVDVKARVMGDLGIVHARTTFTKANGDPGRGWYTDIWQRRDGRWLCIAAHYEVR